MIIGDPRLDLGNKPPWVVENNPAGAGYDVMGRGSTGLHMVPIAIATSLPDALVIAKAYEMRAMLSEIIKKFDSGTVHYRSPEEGADMEDLLDGVIALLNEVGAQ